MDCEAPLAVGGEVCIQLIYVLGATFTPPDGGAASYNYELIGVNSGIHLLMVLYRITLAPLAEELRAADLGLLLRFMRMMRRSKVWHDKVHSS